MQTMIRSKIRHAYLDIRKLFSRNPDRFLSMVSGVVHVGANLGQEREVYAALGLDVVWIEPIPEIFAQLKENVQGFPNQLAIEALVTDIDDKEYVFHIANNDGASSSILAFKEHKDIWPNVAFTSSIKLKSTTLATLFKFNRLDACKYQALIMDTQGSELMVLRGSATILDSFSFIKTEVPDFEAYAGCCQLSDMTRFMTDHGYKEFSRRKFASREKVGSYFDIVYIKHT